MGEIIHTMSFVVHYENEFYKAMKCSQGYLIQIKDGDWNYLKIADSFYIKAFKSNEELSIKHGNVFFAGKDNAYVDGEIFVLPRQDSISRLEHNKICQKHGNNTLEITKEVDYRFPSQLPAGWSFGQLPEEIEIVY